MYGQFVALDLLQNSERAFLVLYEDIRKNEPDKFYWSECDLYFPISSLGTTFRGDSRDFVKYIACDHGVSSTDYFQPFLA